MSPGKPVRVMSNSLDTKGDQLCLHPSVGLKVNPARMTDREKVAAVSKVKSLEHNLFEDAALRRELSASELMGVLAAINQLRRALGWLEVGLDESPQWPRTRH